MTGRADMDALRHARVNSGALFIDGRHSPAERGETLEVLSPIDGSHLTTIADASTGDVDRAVRAARAAFARGAWSRAAPAFRARVPYRIAEPIDTHALELAVLGVRDNGTEFATALKGEPGSAAATFRYHAGAVDKVYGEIAPTAHDVLGLVHREPVRFVELAHEAGLPEGVLNVVTGRGATCGEAMGLHDDSPRSCWKPTSGARWPTRSRRSSEPPRYRPRCCCRSAAWGSGTGLADGTVARPRERRPTGAQPGVRAPAVNATSHSGRPPSKRPTR